MIRLNIRLVEPIDFPLRVHDFVSQFARPDFLEIRQDKIGRNFFGLVEVRQLVDEMAFFYGLFLRPVWIRASSYPEDHIKMSRFVRELERRNKDKKNKIGKKNKKKNFFHR